MILQYKLNYFLLADRVHTVKEKDIKAILEQLVVLSVNYKSYKSSGEKFKMFSKMVPVLVIAAVLASANAIDVYTPTNMSKS